jgi:hypothetical protein
MRAVMDVGGACADGGPYVSAQPCPDGAPAAMFVGSFGLFAFGALGMVFGARVGAPWGVIPILGWSALFGALGWNFLQYGWLNPPEGQGIEPGFLVPGIMFEVMAIVPLAFVAWGWWLTRDVRKAGGGRSASSTPPPVPNEYRRERVATASPSFTAMEAREAAARAGATAPSLARSELPPRQAVLTGIDAAMAAALASPATAAPSSPSAPSTAFAEGTQALLDRLERLGEMRDRGLLQADEYETAKDAVMRELEARS